MLREVTGGTARPGDACGEEKVTVSLQRCVRPVGAGSAAGASACDASLVDAILAPAAERSEMSQIGSANVGQRAEGRVALVVDCDAVALLKRGRQDGQCRAVGHA